jgi:L-threonylcarbamoyladenylate synthase
LVSGGKLPEKGRGIYLQHSHPPSRDILVRQMPASAQDYAAALYDALHQADDRDFDWIAVDLPPAMPEWEAVRDRLCRAATAEEETKR